MTFVFSITKHASNMMKFNHHLAAVTHDGFAIDHLTEAQRTPDVCLAAVKQDGIVIMYLTEAQCTPEVCLAAGNRRYWKGCEYVNAHRKRDYRQNLRKKRQNLRKKKRRH